ncbi:MAG: SDR family oxidoreductase [Planctomycetes bacterium]|nr:SDR family oxidoreductase [Planctomycetota bacterium]
MNDLSQPVQLRPLLESFANRTLLVSGSTGFVAKALVAKISGSLPTVSRIILPIRARNQGEAERRFEREIEGSSAFAALRGSSWRSRIEVLACDLSQPDLGIDAATRATLVKEVEVVINSAASVDFNGPVHLALAANVRAPRALLGLAREAGAPFVQVSTCFVCGLMDGEVPEALHPIPGENLASCLAELEDASRPFFEQDDSEASTRAGRRLAKAKGFADIYSYTKFLGEHVVNDERDGLPTVIVRPAIVESALRDPYPGWLQGFRMLDPLILAHGEGRLRGFPVKPATVLDIIPVDFVANAILAATARLLEGDQTFTVYQVGTSATAPLEARRIARNLEEHFAAEPLQDERGHARTLSAIKLHDPVRYRRQVTWRYDWPLKVGSAIFGRRLPVPGTRLVRRALRRARGALRATLKYVDTYGAYAALDVRFMTDNTRALNSALGAPDRETFDFRLGTLDWDAFLREVHIPGLLRMLREDGTLAASDAPRTTPLNS